MANVAVSIFGTNLPIRLTDIGDKSYALAISTLTPGIPMGANDKAPSLFGTNIPIRLVAQGDGSYALATAVAQSTAQPNDKAVSLFGTNIPIRLVALGDGTHAVAVDVVSAGGAAGSMAFQAFGSGLPMRFMPLGDGSYAMAVATAANPAAANDKMPSLWGINLPSRIVALGDGTYALAVQSENYLSKIQGIAPSNLVAMWPLSELSGTIAYDISGNGRNAAYVGAPKLGQPGIGDGGTSVLLAPASNQWVNIYSTALANAFNGKEGTIAIWFRVRAASVWTDATNRRLFIIAVDGNNQIYTWKTTTNNQLQWVYIAGGTSNNALVTYSATTWSHMAITWSKSGNAAKFYLNGSQSGATLTPVGTFAGTPGSGLMVLGSNGGPGDMWDGYEALAALWSTPLSAAQILSLATVP